MHTFYNGILYIVPTPIGNLSDITHRALEVLKNVNLIAAENIRHTNILLQHFNIKNNLTSMNKDNEKIKSDILIKELQIGKKIALVSNAGTPIINDPGSILIKKCHLYNIKIIPLPGACAAITALSASGITNNRFCYEGFLPTKKTLRCNLLQSLKKETRTIIFYETKHRILESIQDIIEQIDKNRHIVIAREITKKWESIFGATATLMFEWLKKDKYRYKGEMVIIMDGFKKLNTTVFSKKTLDTLLILRNFFSLKQSVSITSKIHNVSKNNLYQYALKNKNDKII
ncbi:16S rRNA (cytidine(1402)-2'-O)-methyltransferase [Buchnera aphidicola]|uniref:Ribosomal RNA small subunit methyltransferase I n=1 Tax=Buchnera aphidicola str. USDA (Myzus persicae) TaxID=1009856 RepID=W0P5F8_BUCMP|nr:16S rRNA (cytidine(1402)-2'-O)-methyltransferase [Buchnera aphidicola]AHG60278.1 Yral [Buchnera aphidicola str. USDA (Myzus persicae)]AHG60856.1 Yral [Buchnera aphidicola str. W106 (Myzus persicae)]AHG61428.1 Yral [Buchnera aphidicola str. G002 (Myzus persicae)]AHG62001.1 Yral [Buchnera aphidicola str. F009 (Myzus persicae)]WAI03035.1 MAG: 16S rRNA (cytidine(1402)-2'-O)-methyltransferase [Buchnera aphidicola (Myzus persicae)]